VVIVDDASTDNTAMKVAAFIEERKLKGITNPVYVAHTPALSRERKC
jgi:glycosyltransferase involved in cell wall biosynthesis